jgi:hypothetical protein
MIPPVAPTVKPGLPATDGDVALLSVAKDLGASKR